MSRSLLLPQGAHLPRQASSSLLAKGFRPFFLLAALWALLLIPLWLFILRGAAVAPAYLEPTAFHAHEMLHGYTVAVLAGFLLTAVGNWTQRETATGLPLLALVLLWVAGRVTLLASGVLAPLAVAVIDLSFLPVLIAVLARPLVATNNRRNFIMLGILGALWLSNAFVHAEALGWVAVGVGRRANLAALNVVVLVMLLMAARIFPMFTRNATGVASIRSIPMLDRAAAAAMLVAIAFDLAAPASPVSGAAFGITGLLALARSVHWGARHSFRDPLLWILHLGHGWLCLGLLLRSAALFGAPSLASLATHALSVGAIGGLTLGMMARVALGHTGRMLTAPAPMTLAFVAMNVAAFLRCFGPLLAPGDYLAVLVASGTFWELSFLIFVATYTPILLGPRVDGRPG